MDQPLNDPPLPPPREPLSASPANPNRPLIVGALVIAALALLAFVIILGGRAADRLMGGPKPETIASSSLESMRAQNRLITFTARYVSVTSSKTSRFGFSAERTLILPGDVRYELDLSKMQPRDVAWDSASKTLRVRLPDVEIAGPEVDLAAAREYGQGGVLAALTNTGADLDHANRAAAVADLRKQAAGDTPMHLAREAARADVERSFAMPLQAAGFTDARVVARFAAEGTDEASFLDSSTSYKDAMKEAERRQAAPAVH